MKRNSKLENINDLPSPTVLFLWERGRGEGVSLIPNPSPIVKSTLGEGRKSKGFTLLEMLLVLAIASVVLLMITNYTTQKAKQTQRDLATIQMQQILNAGLSYYNNNGTWPGTAPVSPTTWVRTNITSSYALVTGKYLPAVPINPMGLASGCDNSYYTAQDSTNGLFILFAAVCGASSAGDAKIIAGNLPSGFVTPNAPVNGPMTPAACTNGTRCYVVSQVNIPGQNLNNARSVNFAGIYSSGQCVPVPACPPNMTPEIFAVPSQIAGTFDSGSVNITTPPAYPITSYAAYATPKGTTPTSCITGSNDTCSSKSGGANNQYWRVCLYVSTDRGVVNATDYQDTFNMGAIVAVTRCVPTGEQIGSTFRVYN